ncbi:MAG: IPT/TIG domain-containing protein [Planctomycetes bacterium]|nr:IPT/TIG domain-containing protein [Planctomycetota bacterium]
MTRPALVLAAAHVALLCASPAAFAVNRFVINNANVPLGSTGNAVPVLADVDQDTYGLSLHIQFDGSKIRVVSVQAGAAVAPLAPEYFDGTITASPGRVVYGTVFDLSNPITKKLAAGAGKEILKLSVDVLAASPTTVLLDLVNVPGNPSRLNVMTNQNGDSVAPAPTLVDGTLTLVSLAPNIQSYTGNSGPPGTEFFVVGQNFNQPGLAVTVCAKTAAFALLGDNQTLRVTAPACAVGPAEVKVCTRFGCDSDPAGFTYEAGPQPPVIDAILDNSGSAGKKFFVVGQNFNSPGFKVKVCGVDATFTVLGDNQTAEVTAPTCGTTGWAQVQACNDVGCDTEPNGFEYLVTTKPFVRGNANNDANVDLSDAVFTLNYLFAGGATPVCLDAADANDVGSVDLSDPIYLLNFLFQGGNPIPPPYPAPGTDPTPDVIGDCV